MVVLSSAELQLDCRGFQLGTVLVPPFVLASTGAVRLHYPNEISEASASLLERTFTQQLTVPFVTFAEDSVVVFPEVEPVHHGLLNRLAPVRAGAYLRRKFGLDTPTASATLRRAGIEPDDEFHKVTFLSRKLLAVELAYLFSDILVVSTAGLDAEGLDPFYAALAPKLATHPTLVLCPPLVGAQGERLFDVREGFRDVFAKNTTAAAAAS